MGLSLIHISVAPYSEQFYIGGANSIRAFTVRSIGPGSYPVSYTHLDVYKRQALCTCQLLRQPGSKVTFTTETPSVTTGAV